MGRWRAPTPPSSPYITEEGAARLRKELTQLWKVERPKVTKIVHEAAKNGDRSENGDYIYGKQRLREIDRRVGYLDRRLKVLKIIADKPKEKDRVFFSAYVTLVCNSETGGGENSATRQIRIVGADEIDAKLGWISIDAPFAKALLKQYEGDEIADPVDKDKVWTITAVRY